MSFVAFLLHIIVCLSISTPFMVCSGKTIKQFTWRAFARLAQVYEELRLFISVCSHSDNGCAVFSCILFCRNLRLLISSSNNAVIWFSSQTSLPPSNPRQVVVWLARRKLGMPFDVGLSSRMYFMLDERDSDIS